MKWMTKCLVGLGLVVAAAGCKADPGLEKLAGHWIAEGDSGDEFSLDEDGIGIGSFVNIGTDIAVQADVDSFNAYRLNFGFGSSDEGSPILVGCRLDGDSTLRCAEPGLFGTEDPSARTYVRF